MTPTEAVKIREANRLITKAPCPLILTDFYKIGHPFQYPDGTQYVYSNWTPRKSRIDGIDQMVLFGPQMLCQRILIDYFEEHFFSKKLEDVLAEYKRIIENTIGVLQTYDHIAALHKLGHLPITIKALPEGTLVPMRIPCITIINTDPEFYWVTNWVESLFSTEVWKMCTSATLAHNYRIILDKYAKETGMHPDFVQYQGHDFSFRGLDGWDSSMRSGMAHLLSFVGTDTIPAICGLEYYYGADVEKGLVGCSVPATEHSVMCSGGKETEVETIRRLITKIYPAGIVSVVSDTWDLWKVCTDYLTELKAEVLARDGKVVIRPDSGEPELIICGNPDGKSDAERKGVVECLWDIFGGTTTEKGFRLLDKHIGVIYGDSITLARARAICEGLKAKGFASQVVFGIGSYTYQYTTRDTFGLAMKATYVKIKDQPHNIFKDPVTDSGMKKSMCGLIKVYRDATGRLTASEQVNWEEEANTELEIVFSNGKMHRFQTLQEIRNLLAKERALNH